MKHPLSIIGHLLLLGVLLLAAHAKLAFGEDQTRWVGTWACSPQHADADISPRASELADISIRQIVHVSIGGKTLRVRFSNAFGNSALVLTAAHIAKAVNGKIETTTDRALSFHGQPSASIPAGALMVSDPVDFDLAALSDLAVTIHLASVPEGVTIHSGARATSYFVHGAAVSQPEWASAQNADHWYFLNGVDVAVRKRPASVVVLGDSITDGKNSTTNGNGRWTDVLARRLHANKHTVDIGVLNEGIGGNRLLRDGLGPNALARLDRDVLAQTGIRWLIVLEGVNDIGTCTKTCDLASTTRDIIAAYEQMIVRAHSHGIRVYGATIMPFGRSFYASPDAERARQDVNEWVRTPGRFDAVIDFDAVTRDPQNSADLSATADSGDHLHPNDAGYKLMGDSINLKLFAK